MVSNLLAVSPGNAERGSKKERKASVSIRVNLTKQGFIPDEIKFFTQQINKWIIMNCCLIRLSLSPNQTEVLKPLLKNINRNLIYFA
ncbi:MAG: hypothetical protein IPL16_15420 [Ignavibacteria bacterium]|nr:hypothetical protein [Ignavibacteria bacterium]